MKYVLDSRVVLKWVLAERDFEHWRNGKFANI